MKRKPNRFQRTWQDSIIDAKIKTLYEQGLSEFNVVKMISYEDAIAMKGLYEARWETPEGAICRTFNIARDTEVLRPGDHLELNARLTINPRRASDPEIHLCDSL